MNVKSDSYIRVPEIILTPKVAERLDEDDRGKVKQQLYLQIIFIYLIKKIFWGFIYFFIIFHLLKILIITIMT